jgi:GGDEF domain-containing protein
VPWQLHALSALAATGYLAIIAAVLWGRYSYLIELRQVMAYGPAYDPVTRMRSHAETGQMVGAAFYRHDGEPLSVGVLAMSISNLYALEKLHGRAAVNHALFVTAARLRRSVSGGVEMGRLGDDGFLLLLRNMRNPERLIRLARAVVARLQRPVALSTSRDPAALESKARPTGRPTWAWACWLRPTPTSARPAPWPWRAPCRAAPGPTRAALPGTTRQPGRSRNCHQANLFERHGCAAAPIIAGFERTRLVPEHHLP